MAVSRSTEVELKYAVAADVALPDLAAVPGVRRAEAQPVAHLEAVYVDTADRTLLAARIAVRRRTGGHDAGWHVKLPGATGRTELHAPIDPELPDQVPAELERALASRVRGRALVPLARITTERRAVVVAGTDGGRVEVVDDDVRAVDVATGTVRSWREWEAERVGDAAADDAVLRSVDVALRAAGAAPSESPAKLAQALGLRPRRLRPPSDAGGVLQRIVAPLADDLHRAMTGLVLDGDADGTAVHEMRKTLRRLRSALSLEPVAGPSGAAVRDGLRGFAGPLGDARDPLVAAATAERLLAGLPRRTPGRRAARAVLVDAVRARAADRTAAAVEALLEADALAIWAALDAFVTAGPDGPAAGARPKRLRRLAWKTVRRAARRAAKGGPGLESMHAARKAAKRARMVVEELVDAGVVGRRSDLARSARRDERVQAALGEHRDLALVLDTLPATSERMAAEGANTFALGRAAEIGERRLRRLLVTARKRMRALRG